MFYVCFLAFPSLNHWRMHTKCARVLCPSILVWCSLQVTRGNHEDNVRVVHAKFSCSCVQTREFFKNTRVELQNTRVWVTRVFQVIIELYRMYLCNFCNFCNFLLLDHAIDY